MYKRKRKTRARPDSAECLDVGVQRNQGRSGMTRSPLLRSCKDRKTKQADANANEGSQESELEEKEP